MDATHTPRSRGGRPAVNPRVGCGNPKCTKTVVVDSKKRAAYERGEAVYCDRACRLAVTSAKVTVTCSVCGDPVEKFKSDVERNQTGKFFCGKGCQGKSNSRPRTGTTAPCATCGKDVYRPPNLSDGPRYCDQDCWAKSLEGERVERDEQKCIVCGTTWRRTLSQMYQDVQTCNPDCTAKSRRAPEGHRWIDPKKGYVWITAPDGRRMQEHTYVMEQEFGGPLPEGSTVHHKRGGFKGRSNNALDNLELWTGNHPKGHRVEDVTDYCLDHEETYVGLMSDEQLARLVALGQQAAERLAALAAA